LPCARRKVGGALGLAFVAELEGAQFAVDEMQVGDVTVVEGSAVEDEVEEVVPGPWGEIQSTQSRVPTWMASPSSSRSSRRTASAGGSLASAMPLGRSQSGL
jgi:hypothetical protein